MSQLSPRLTFGFDGESVSNLGVASLHIGSHSRSATLREILVVIVWALGRRLRNDNNRVNLGDAYRVQLRYDGIEDVIVAHIHRVEPRLIPSEVYLIGEGIAYVHALLGDSRNSHHDEE